MLPLRFRAFALLLAFFSHIISRNDVNRGSTQIGSHIFGPESHPGDSRISPQSLLSLSLTSNTPARKDDQGNGSGSRASSGPGATGETSPNQSYSDAVEELRNIDLGDDQTQMLSFKCTELIALQDLLSYLLGLFITSASDLEGFAILNSCLETLLEIKASKDLNKYKINFGISALLNAISKVSGALSSRDTFLSKSSNLAIEATSAQELLSVLIMQCRLSDDQIITLPAYYSNILELPDKLESRLKGVESLKKYFLDTYKNYCDEAFISNIRYLIQNMKRHVHFKTESRTTKQKAKGTEAKKKQEPSGARTKRKAETSTSSAHANTRQSRYRHYMNPTKSSIAKARPKHLG